MSTSIAGESRVVVVCLCVVRCLLQQGGASWPSSFAPFLYLRSILERVVCTSCVDQLNANVSLPPLSSFSFSIRPSWKILPSPANPTSPLLHSPLIQRLLARYLTSLALHPLRTKSITAAILFALQEVLANRLSGQHAASIRAKAQQLKGKAQSGQGVLGRLSRADVLGALGEVGVTTKAIQVSLASERSERERHASERQ